MRSLNERSELVASFRQSFDRCDYALSAERTEVPAGGGDFSVTVESSCEWQVAKFGDFLELDPNPTGNTSGQIRYRVSANEGSARVAYVTVAGETLSVYQSGLVPPTNVCERTPHIRDAISLVVGADCDVISEFDLLEVVTLEHEAQSFDDRIDELGAGDFSGLGRLTHLSLFNNAINAIPAEAFDDLSKLKELNLSRNRLVTVPEAIRALSSLQRLDLRSNQISHVPEESFTGLGKLRWLILLENAITSLPDDVFMELEELRYLILGRNQITDISKEVLQGPSSLIRLNLSSNPLVELREDVFSNISNVLTVDLRDTQLVSLPRNVFAGLTRVGWLLLSSNDLTDISNVVFPGNSIGSFQLAHNELRSLPPGMFEDFTSPICGARNLNLNLSGNPGAPFPLTLMLDRVDGGNASAGPASVVVRLREGASWPITVQVGAEDDASFLTEVTIPNGDTASVPFQVGGSEPVRLRIVARPTIPGSYQGVRIALGEALPLFAIPDQALHLRHGPHDIDLDELVGEPGVVYLYETVSNDESVAEVSIVDGELRIEPVAIGGATISLTTESPDGVRHTFNFEVRVDDTSRLTDVPHLPVPQLENDATSGLVRVINHSPVAGQCQIDAVDDSGERFETQTLPLRAHATQHVSSSDLLSGNSNIDLADGFGGGDGSWRLQLTSDLDLEALSYVTIEGGYLAAMHDVAPEIDGVHEVPMFNPGDELDQVSTLRLINQSPNDNLIEIEGADEGGESPGSVVGALVPANTVLHVSASDLETGEGLLGALGDGMGTWRLRVTASQDVQVMNLLRGPNGLLSNLSTMPMASDGTWVIPLMPSMSDPHQRQGVLRVVNPGDAVADVQIRAFDVTGRDYDTLTLTVGAGETIHVTSDDLELGNADLGLEGSTGAGEGDWALELTSESDLMVVSYVRTVDGFLTSMHDVAPAVENRHRVATFWSRDDVRSGKLRLVNPHEETAAVSIRGVADNGDAGVERVRATLPPLTAVTWTAEQLELGGETMDGALGHGSGSWRLVLEADREIAVMSLVESEDGYLTNISSAPNR